MLSKDTIIALATPSGVGAISIIRLSGENAISICATHFKSIRNKDLNTQRSHTIQLGYIIDNELTIDKVLVYIYKSPHSYTGENVIEISCHGSIYIQQQIIQLFLKNGCRMANNGEFTMRSFLNGKMDLSQAEAVADLIASNSAASHQIAIQQMRGGFATELKKLRQQLLDFAALIELELDFSGEDVEFANRAKFKELVIEIISVLKRLIDSFSFGNVIKNGIPVAIIGQPNVGKSTLLNILLNEERAIVSEIAGTTRDAIEDELIINGILFRFIDTAGIRKTKDLVENIGIQKTYEKAQQAQLIIYLVLASDLLNKTKMYYEEIEKMKQKFKNKRILIVANKIDQLKGTDKNEIQSKFSNILLLSTKEKIGVKTLKKELLKLVNIGALSNNETIVSNSRHFEALNNALQSILEVKKGLDTNIPSDLFAIDIRECLKNIGTITGEYDVDKDILGHIFSKFCIGK